MVHFCLELLDEDFKKKVNECKDAESRKALIKAEGFDFTKEALDGIVGGFFTWCPGLDVYLEDIRKHYMEF